MTQRPLTRVLIVDDDGDVRLLTRMALETVGGLTVEACSSGREALEKAPGFEPDMILLDVMMPDMDGPSTLTALREIPQFESTPVIFLTAKVQPREVAKYKQAGALDVLRKPFDPMTISDTIRGIWSRSQA